MNRLNLYSEEPEAKSILPKLCESLAASFRLQGLAASMTGDELCIKIGHKTAWIDKSGKLTGESNTPGALD